jgi:hypothetical protein
MRAPNHVLSGQYAVDVMNKVGFTSPRPTGGGRFAPGDANGSRERAPDDRLRIVQSRSGEARTFRASGTPQNLDAPRICPYTFAVP